MEAAAFSFCFRPADFSAFTTVGPGRTVGTDLTTGVRTGVGAASASCCITHSAIER